MVSAMLLLATTVADANELWIRVERGGIHSSSRMAQQGAYELLLPGRDESGNSEICTLSRRRTL